MEELNEKLPAGMDLLNINPYVRYVAKITNTSEEHHVPERLLYDYSLIFVLSGQLKFRFSDGHEVILETGDIHIMPPLVVHKEYIDRDMSCTYFVVHFDMHYSPEFSRWSIDGVYLKNCRDGIKNVAVDEEFAEKARAVIKEEFQPVKFHVTQINEVMELIQNAYELFVRTELPNRTVYQELQLKAYLYGILARIFGEEEEESDEYHRVYVNRFIEYCFEHYDEEFDYAELVAKFGFTPNYFRKIFKKLTDVTPWDFMKNVRMKKAKRMLSKSTLSVTEIAAAVGYPDPLYFSKCFKKEMGCSPTEYRNNYIDAETGD